jgi:cellobiose dehydrogenase (acceptor)
MKNRSNFKLISSAMVNYIIQYKGKATGIVYNDHIYVFLTSRGAIAMGAGALNTPKILIQSGIGPQDQLNILYNRKDFPGVRQNGTNGWILNENVGKNLLDTNVVFAVFQHPEMKSFQPRNRPQGAIDQYMNQDQTGPWANSGPVMIAYENYTVNNRMYQFQLTVIPSDFGEFAQYSNIFTTSLYVNNPEARDYASFSLDGKWWGITKNKIYLSSPNDLAAMQSYAKRIIDTITSTGATFLSASKGQTVEEWVSSHRNWITHHFAGTCYTSSDSHDVTKCADEKFRVIGTTNVFVADGSLMKEGTVNPYGFIMYIGREAGNLLEEYLNE